jgi:transketolase N-terminal domain/subunit
MISELESKALDLRRTIVKMSYIAGTGHVTSACSCLDISYRFISEVRKESG